LSNHWICFGLQGPWDCRALSLWGLLGSRSLGTARPCVSWDCWVPGAFRAWVPWYCLVLGLKRNNIYLSIYAGSLGTAGPWVPWYCWALGPLVLPDPGSLAKGLGTAGPWVPWYCWSLGPLGRAARHRTQTGGRRVLSGYPILPRANTSTEEGTRPGSHGPPAWRLQDISDP
jgi:hypothetical protein